MKFKVLIIVLISTTTIFGETEYSEELNKITSLVPLQNGNMWIYKGGTYIQAHSKQLFNGITVFHAHISDGFLSGQYCMYNTEDGYWENTDCLDDRFRSNFRRYYFKYPADKGEIYIDTFEYNSRSYNRSYEIVETERKTKTIAGTFNCYVYKIHSNHSTYQLNNNIYTCYYEYHFAPGVGFVLKNIFISNDKFEWLEEFDVIRSWELKEFKTVR